MGSDDELDESPPTREELLELRDKWEYEVMMLEVAYRRLEQATREHDLMLEAFLLHVRTLTDFYLDDPRKDKDDVVAKQYVEHGLVDENWKSSEAAGKQETLNKHRTTLNKSLAHLTAWRVRQKPKPDHPVGALYESLGLLNEEFRRGLRQKTKAE